MNERYSMDSDASLFVNPEVEGVRGNLLTCKGCYLERFCFGEHKSSMNPRALNCYISNLDIEVLVN